MFLHKVGDKVKLSKQAKNILDKQLFDALSDEVFTIVDITTDNSCENNNPNCTCDKFINIKNGNVILTSLVSDELVIYKIKEALND